MGLRDYIAFAAKQYGADPGLLDNIARLESTYNPRVQNNWDSNARAGTPSYGLMQFIKPTFDSFAKEARAANPNAWRNFQTLNWKDPRQQALTASWAVANGKGSHWATYDRAKEAAKNYNYTPRFRSARGNAAGHPGAPQLPSAPAQLNPRELARLAQMKVSLREFDPVEASEDQIRKLALAGDAASVIRGVNSERKLSTEDFNEQALEYNRSVEAQMRAAKNAAARERAQQQWIAQAGQTLANTSTGDTPINPGAKGWFRTPQGRVQNRRENEPAWQFLQRLGKGFGLENDPGNSQTTGGRHSEGSHHYSGTAIDFGDARNSRAQLNAWMNWLNKRRNILGIVELLDEGDHIHVALKG